MSIYLVLTSRTIEDSNAGLPDFDILTPSEQLWSKCEFQSFSRARFLLKSGTLPPKRKYVMIERMTMYNLTHPHMHGDGLDPWRWVTNVTCSLYYNIHAITNVQYIFTMQVEYILIHTEYHMCACYDQCFNPFSLCRSRIHLITRNITRGTSGRNADKSRRSLGYENRCNSPLFTSSDYKTFVRQTHPTKNPTS